MGLPNVASKRFITPGRTIFVLSLFWPNHHKLYLHLVPFVHALDQVKLENQGISSFEHTSHLKQSRGTSTRHYPRPVCKQDKPKTAAAWT
ncbi:hypothetical protein VNO77_31262 [Canavalia gladiata]|uniref:Uncharacterized protein n=1 Tax=Canavalia gladiata TaxID=3824 RepID=A0AAN9KRJ2_CANGL